MVNAVENQGQCGSCWAFSTISTIETANAIKTDNLLKLSEQQFVDCVTGCAGCNGGWFTPPYHYAMSNKVMLDSAYPYTHTNGTCTTSQKLQEGYSGQVRLSNYQSVASNNIDQMKKAVTIGAVGVAVDASSTEFSHYTGGVLNSQACGTSWDHAVAVVGYGTENGSEYLYVRNSWGPYWGDQGYIKIAMSSENICGIMTYPYYPVV